MKINDKTVNTYKAARELLQLYDAYRASTRAQIAAIQQIKRHLFPSNSELTQEQIAEQSKLNREESLFWHMDATFGVRREQVLHRIFELQDIPELP